MSRTIVNFWLDVLLLLVFLVLAWTSVVLRFVFPPGPAAADWLLWGWDYVDWCDFRFAVFCLFALVVLLHVMLHWSWVCGVIVTRMQGKKTKLDDGVRTLYGVATLIVLLNLLGAAVVAAMLSVSPPSG